MAYSDLAALRKRVPEQVLIDLTDDDDLGQVGQAVVDQAIADADAEINTYLSERYALPVSPVTDQVQLLSLSLAVENLYGRNPGLDVPEAVVRAAKNARALLGKIADGMALPGVAEKNDTGTGNSGAMFVAPDRLFTRDSLKGM